MIAAFASGCVIAAAAGLQLVVNSTSQGPCNVLRAAEHHIAKEFPFIEAAGRRPVISEGDNVWEVTFALPNGALGFVPIVTVDKRTCMIVRARVEQ